MQTIAIIGFVSSIVTLLAVWGNLDAMYFNWKYFRRGGVRITYFSGSYVIKSGDLNGKVLYKSSDNPRDYDVYREMGKIEHYEDIPPFFKWNVKHWVDDIRTPQYSLRLLKCSL